MYYVSQLQKHECLLLDLYLNRDLVSGVDLLLFFEYRWIGNKKVGSMCDDDDYYVAVHIIRLQHGLGYCLSIYCLDE